MKRIVHLGLIILLLVNLVACGEKRSVSTWQEQYDLGVRYLSEGNYEEAIIAFRAAIEIDGMNIDGYLGLGNAYCGTHEFEKAIETFVVVFNMDATSIEACIGLGDAYWELGNYEEAARYYWKTKFRGANETTYLRLAKLYLSMNDIYSATYALEEGWNSTRNEDILKMYRDVFVPISKQEIYRPNGDLEIAYEYTWDDLKRLIACNHYEIGWLDSLGRWIETESREGNLECTETQTWSYNDVSGTVTMRESMITGHENVSEYEYDCAIGVYGVINGLGSPYCTTSSNPYRKTETYEYTETGEYDGIVLSNHDYVSNFGGHSKYTFDEADMVTRIDSYDENGILTGYTLIAYAK